MKQWHEYDCGHTELPVDAIAWMKANHISGRIFNRCEDGGILQQEGYDHGETFADTGFGKYDEAFIHEVGLVNERPALIPKFIAAYHPDFIVCGNLCYQWPYYLRTTGWRLIFYTPNSTVWTRPETRLDLATVADDQIATVFDQDLKANGVPSQIALYGRNIIALNSLGLSDFASNKMTQQPLQFKFQSWYWEAARILCFNDPPFSAILRKRLVHELPWLQHTDLTLAALVDEFVAYANHADGRDDDAFGMLRGTPLSNASADLLTKIELDRNDPAALTLARRTDCWDLRNGKHWQYLAEAEERWGSLDAARAAWKKAVFYYPDDDELMKAASEFATKHNDAELARQIADSAKIYGAP